MAFDEKLAERISAPGELDRAFGKIRADTSGSAMSLGGTFKAKLWRYEGPGGWHFVTVPERLAPPVTHRWGRTPVDAAVDGYAWKTSVWRDKRRRTLLAVPKRARGTKEDGDKVSVTIRFRAL